METININDLIPVLQNSKLVGEFDDEITIPTKFKIDTQDKCKYYDIEKPNAPYQCPTYFSKKKFKEKFKEKIIKKFQEKRADYLRGADVYLTGYDEFKVHKMYIKSLMY